MEIKPISKKVMIGLSIFAIVAGALFCGLGTGLLYILFTILGAFIVLGGVFALVKLDPLGGVFGIVIGALLIAGAWLFVDVLIVINGVLLVISGLFGTFAAIKVEDGKKCIISILTLVIGVLFFITNVVEWIFFVIGALFIVSGIVGIILALTQNKDKKIKTVDVKDIK